MLLLNLPSQRIIPERCNFIGAMMLCALTDRIFARSVTGHTRRLHIYLDEYQRFATRTTAQLSTQGRKYGVGLTLAHQGRGQLDDAGVQDAELQAGTLIVLAVTGQDAEVLAQELPVTPQPEWTEHIPVPAGTEPELVPTRKPARHLADHGHRNPAITAAARQLFTPAQERAGKPVDSGWPRVTVSPDDPAINQLLVDAMEGKLAQPEQLHSRLVDLVYAFSEGGTRLAAGTGAPRESDRLTKEFTEQPGRYSGMLVPIDYSQYGWSTIRFSRWKPEDVPEVMRELGSWLGMYIAFFNQNPRPKPLIPKAPLLMMNQLLYEFARGRQEAHPTWRGSWVAPIPPLSFRVDPRTLRANYRAEFVSLTDEDRRQQLAYLRRVVEVMGERVEALLILCKELAADGTGCP